MTAHLANADWSSVDPSAHRLVPERFARAHGIYPLRHSVHELVVATNAPDDLECQQALEFASGRNVRFELASAAEIEAAWNAGHDDSAPADLDTSVFSPDDEADADESGDLTVRFVGEILDEAVRARATDVHVEPYAAGGGRVRLRIDGVLEAGTPISAAMYPRVISRLKVVGSLDIASRNRPQDGRCSHVTAAGAAVDLRLSTLPTRDGEKAVVRILNPGSAPTLDRLGTPAHEAAALDEALRVRDGIIAITGPTGSGKSTTLVAAIQALDKHGMNISTVEDPIEIRIPGVNQTQVNVAQGVTFAGALRALLRQDPDVLMIGEIRDAETAATAVQAANTGHLVLTTLHTNDAVGALPRLAELGVRDTAVADALRAVVAQRLVRRLCDACAVPADPLSEQEQLAAARYGVRPARRPMGCPECRQTGFRGRAAAMEVLPMVPAVADAVRSGAPLDSIRAAARAAGMRSLRECGLAMVANGTTTLDELVRVLGVERQHADASPTTAEPSLDRPSARTPETPPSREGTAPAVLLADDDVSDLMDWEREFASQSWRVTMAVNGTEAAQRLAQGVYDCVVLRLRLPEISGRELLARLRREGRDVPVIIVTNLDSAELEVRLLDDGADDYLHKPVPAAVLVARARTVLARRRARNT
jgi:type II secretory ATPase GspE/PulE/Tfp pilus assembly ATPase PilB-like protein/ActR/RegA family two-component response regulator